MSAEMFFLRYYPQKLKVGFFHILGDVQGNLGWDWERNKRDQEIMRQPFLAGESQRSLHGWKICRNKGGQLQRYIGERPLRKAKALNYKSFTTKHKHLGSVVQKAVSDIPGLTV